MPDAYKLTCPYCGFQGGETEFGMSLADECFCPKCGEDFLLGHDDDEDDELDEEE